MLGLLARFIRRMVEKLLPPWYYPPPQFQSFDVQGAIPTPAIGATPAAIVLTLLVPQGYCAVIRRLSINVSGPGFVQASGSLIFAITVDQAPYKNYAQIVTELGSVQWPRDTDGILANSNQTYQVTCLNVAYASGGTMIVASLGGWFYPDPKQKRQAVSS
jgi:hypothetical protein